MAERKPDSPRVPPGPNTLRDHLANERTFLAWMRTAIAIIALGFVVAKFGLALRLEAGNHVRGETVRLGAAVGVVLVLSGMVTAVPSSVKFLQTRSDIDLNIVNFRPSLDITLAVVVALIAVILAVYIEATS